VLGHSHALSGLAVGAATVPFAPLSGAVEQAAWIAAVGGFAMLPDLDQHGATISRMWGPLTNIPAGWVGHLAHGHREGTHDPLLAPLVFGGLATLAALSPWTRLLLLALAIGLALRAGAFAIPGRAETTALGNLAASWLCAYLLIDHGHAPTWLASAVALGVLVHIAGDLLTVGGVPVPLTGWRAGGPRLSLHLFRTGSRTEHALCALAFGPLLAWQLYANLSGLAPAVHPILAALGAHA
jgi:hypothetical protein